ncbi:MULTISPECIES: Cu(I)-responsive transcriptional regulator [unclassified Colwellia]|uniref:Cu(I)-responsive transcriptional regulator n=1 Tax=unclassified Colwellia TaxID=196834 RepID=UPI0015F71586|nr:MULTISPECIES: Cu(I)-responsive transcriptional regulator [unclassified Colwellia]MBA6355373.1 Cu(I)-responsive transcriptional regulator [Colwellia sp. BRX8-3]MBA6358719.1 Cu(I)-responsive transcriptional regulator [Colwellia sp. BRX8-6]MBA6367306.1 Cu(I)-responsive transcriptional regulator [Colwellia sp. BRX8-5]MBA6373727.1 Cu(I)-responsive transcriptional regulator [Colwellia sp. BRX8-2]MBA6382337.1 Cu(I)-responsive transcriptional regulator [Colwellia sp. BRX10-9]
MAKLVTIGKASNLTGVSAKMIRYYEEIGVLKKTSRTDAGYRLYNQAHIQQLGFIRRSRNLGFSMIEIQSLLKFWLDTDRESRHVKQLAVSHLQEINEKILELEQMRAILQKLADQCDGDDNPDCPILEGLAQLSSE